MFERNKIDNSEQGTVSVEITLVDGSDLTGKVFMAAGRQFHEFLNGANAFVEFETFEGEKAFLAKSQLRKARPIAPVRAVNLAQRVRDLDGFDPYSILGLERGVAWDEIRSQFHKLAKVYHPDRYATAELPEEVKTYLSAMARRINAAYAALEAAHAQKRQYAKLKQAPIYTSQPRT
jgi:hypothetical protein